MTSCFLWLAPYTNEILDVDTSKIVFVGKDTGLKSCVENSKARKARKALDHIEGLGVDETMILNISGSGVAWTDLAQSWICEGLVLYQLGEFYTRQATYV